MLTLQWYITRETLKTFALTAIGLTLVFTMCGGIFNMIRVDVLTALQLWTILVRVIPIATTFTLPVATLFSIAMVYGRLSADNEFNACRASGVNIQWLLAPAMVLGIFTMFFTFGFTNYVIPHVVEGLEQIVRDDPQKVVTNTLYTRGYVEYLGKYVIHADAFNKFTVPATFDNPTADRDHYVELRQASFIEMEHGDLVRFGTTPGVTIQFKAPVRPEDDPLVVARMTDVRLFDQQRHQFYQLGEQRLGPAPIPWKAKHKIKFMTLPELLRYRTQAWKLPEIESRLPRLREFVQQYYFYRALREAMTGGEKKFVIGTKDRGYELRAASVPVSRESGQPRFDQPVIRQWWDGMHRTFRAVSGTVAVERSFADERPSVYIKLGNGVTFTDEVDPSKEIRRASIELEAVPLPQSIIDKTDALSDADLLNADKPLGLSDRIDDGRQALARSQVLLVNRILSEVHSRCAFSLSVIVLVVLGAMLGIILRGGQALSAFVIAFLPGLFVTIVIIMGRQYAEKNLSPTIGLAVLWSGIAAVAIADVVVLARYLRR